MIPPFDALEILCKILWKMEHLLQGPNALFSIVFSKVFKNLLFSMLSKIENDVIILKSLWSKGLITSESVSENLELIAYM